MSERRARGDREGPAISSIPSNWYTIGKTQYQCPQLFWHSGHAIARLWSMVSVSGVNVDVGVRKSAMLSLVRQFWGIYVLFHAIFTT